MPRTRVDPPTMLLRAMKNSASRPTPALTPRSPPTISSMVADAGLTSARLEAAMLVAETWLSGPSPSLGNGAIIPQCLAQAMATLGQTASHGLRWAAAKPSTSIFR